MVRKYLMRWIGIRNPPAVRIFFIAVSASERKCFAPYGISFTKNAMARMSPTNVELANGSNWELVNTGGLTKQYIDHKNIPIAQIISRG